MGLIPSFTLPFFHFILVFTEEIIFHFHGNEQIYTGYCVWNVFLHQPPHKGFIGLIPSSIPAILYFIHAVIVSHCHGSHEQFHIGYCVWNVTLLHPARKDFISLISPSILAFLHFILVSIAEIIFHFHGNEQFHMGYCVWNASHHHPVHKDFIGFIPSSIPAFLHFLLASIAKIIFHFHGSTWTVPHRIIWNVFHLYSARKDFIGIIPSSIPVFPYFTGFHSSFSW